MESIKYFLWASSDLYLVIGTFYFGIFVTKYVTRNKLIQLIIGALTCNFIAPSIAKYFKTPGATLASKLPFNSYYLPITIVSSIVVVGAFIFEKNKH